MKGMYGLATAMFLALLATQGAVAEEVREPRDALDFTVKNIEGKDVSLDRYRGNVVLMVNVASKCGFTGQYEQLQALHERYAEKGLAILGFPANNFMGQEPGTAEEIKLFCRMEYGVTFDMFSKISVKDGDIAPLYAFLTSKEKNPDHGGAIKWNFTKFLLGRDGKVIARYGSRTKPDAPKVVEAIEAALAHTAEDDGQA